MAAQCQVRRRTSSACGQCAGHGSPRKLPVRAPWVFARSARKFSARRVHARDRERTLWLETAWHIENPPAQSREEVDVHAPCTYFVRRARDIDEVG